MTNLSIFNNRLYFNISKYSNCCEAFLKLQAINKFQGSCCLGFRKWTLMEVKLPHLRLQHYALLHSSSLTNFQENQDIKSLAIVENIKQMKYSPKAALTLGFSGLLPFVFAPAYMIYSGTFIPNIATAQLVYGASILSFLGGIRWGLTLPSNSEQFPNWHNLGYSVMPSLLACGVLLCPPVLGSLTLIGGLSFTGYMDIAMWGYPNWFKGLRFCLTLVAVLSIWTALICKFIFKVNSGVQNADA